MPRQGFMVVVLLAALFVWWVGHGGAAVALLLLALCLQMSAYVRHLRPPHAGLWPRRQAGGGLDQD